MPRPWPRRWQRSRNSSPTHRRKWWWPHHLMGLYELGAIHLSQQPPNLSEAALAIDAMGAVVDRLQGRLGENEETLRGALDQIRLAYVGIQSRQPSGTRRRHRGLGRLRVT